MLIPDASFVDSVRFCARFSYDTDGGVREGFGVKNSFRKNDEEEDEEGDEKVELEEPLKELEVRDHTSSKMTLNFL